MQPKKLNPPHYFLIAIFVVLGLDLIPATPLLSSPWPWAIGILLVLVGTGCTGQGARLFSQ